MPDTITFAENQILIKALDYLDFSDDLPQIARDEIKRKLETEQREFADNLNDTLNKVLQDELFSGWVEVFPEQEIPVREGYGIKIREKKKKGETVKITFYKVKNSAFSSTLSTIGLTVGVILKSVTLPLTVVGLAYTFWKNLVTLEKGRDDLAIQTYKSLLRAQADNQLEHPTTKQVHAVMSESNIDSTVNGLITLKNKGILEIAKWGGSNEDWLHHDNAWKLAF